MSARKALLVVVGLAALTFAVAAPAQAGAEDYHFEAVSTAVHNGTGSEIAIRIVHTPTGRTIDNAIIFRTRLDMSPDDMDDMEARIIPASSQEPGTYRFNADLTMAGRWALKLMAKVPGEKDTITGTVILEAQD
jgi:hypothetical protein